MPDTEALRAREGCSPQVRFLVARKVGTPEAVYSLGGWKIKEGESVTHLETRPPGHRRRALARNDAATQAEVPGNNGGDNDSGDEDDAGSQQLRFHDGQVEQYGKRPRATAGLLAGARVRVLHGRYSRSEGTLAAWQPLTRTWSVALDPVQRQRRGAARAAAPPVVCITLPAQDVEATQGFAVGQRVRLCGLHNEQAVLNGVLCVLTAWRAAQARWEARCIDEQVT